MTTRRMALLALPVLFVIAPALLHSANAPDYKAPTKDWSRGPVRWIMTDDEEKEIKKLRTDDERAVFVKAFWEKRDPTPGTPENEYMVIFWARVEQADKTFKSITKPGSQTDMGRVFLLLGPPTENDKDPRGYTIWNYEPNDITGIETKLEFRFAPAETGALLLDRKGFEQYVTGHPATHGIGWKLPVAPPIEAGLPLDTTAPTRSAAEDETPESKRQIPILEAVLAKGSGPAEVPFQVSFDYYATVDGTALTAITVETTQEAAHGSGDVALQPYARITPASGEGKSVNLTGEHPFVAATAGDTPPGSYIYQARHNLAPGTYKVAVIVEDKVVKGQMGSLVKTIEVPNFASKELVLSSIALLAKFARQDDAMGPDEAEHGAGPFVLGSFRLIPHASGVLQKDEALSFYYQIYNPGTDPATSRLALEATYSFFLKDAGAWKPFRKPIVKPLPVQVELYAIDLKDLLIPGQKLPADFRLEIKVTDKPTAKQARREVLFSVR